MAQKKLTGLGRGLDAVFLENETDNPGSVTMLRVAEIEPNPDQPRKTFDEKALGELAASIREHGLIQPIVVKRSKSEGYYTIIAGERRWRASRLAGLDEIPVVVMELDDKTSAQIALIENVQREDLDPVEEAAAYRKLIDDFGMTQEALASKIGKSRPAITNSLRLLELNAEVLKMLSAGKLTSGHCRALLGLTDKGILTKTAEQVAEKTLSVRDTEALVKKLNKAKKDENKPKKPEIETISPDYTAILAEKMTKKLGRKIDIFKNGKQGKVTILFTSDDELNDIVTQLCGENVFDE